MQFGHDLAGLLLGSGLGALRFHVNPGDRGRDESARSVGTDQTKGHLQREGAGNAKVHRGDEGRAEEGSDTVIGTLHGVSYVACCLPLS